MAARPAHFASPLRLHHVAYAVASIEAHIERFVTPLVEPVHITEPVEDPLQSVRVCFVTVPGGALIELVEPLGPDSPVRVFLGDRRGGLYHVCYEVDDLDAAVHKFRSIRCLLLTKPMPAIAFGGRRIAFLLTPERDLVELLEADRLKDDV